MHPLNNINEWLKIEKELGSPYPDRIVLATATKNGIPHSRIVAMREINEDNILFFTQKGTRKVIEMNENPNASMTLWLPLQQREVVLDGKIQALTEEENQQYWQSLPKERQLGFLTYSPTSLQPANSLDEIKTKIDAVTAQYVNSDIPMSEFFCGFRFFPESLYFYTLAANFVSEVVRYIRHEAGWQEQLLWP